MSFFSKPHNFWWKICFSKFFCAFIRPLTMLQKTQHHHSLVLQRLNWQLFQKHLIFAMFLIRREFCLDRNEITSICYYFTATRSWLLKNKFIRVPIEEQDRCIMFAISQFFAWSLNRISCVSNIKLRFQQKLVLWGA